MKTDERECDYPRCMCDFEWYGNGGHPPCPVTGRRHPEMLKHPCYLTCTDDEGMQV